MGEASETKDRSGPPPGYKKCPAPDCPRWKWDTLQWCTTCWTDGARSATADGLHHDWTPPPIPAAEPAKPQHPERRAGQTWGYQWMGGKMIEAVIGRRSEADDAWLWDGSGIGGGWKDGAWANPNITMTLTADAPTPEATVKVEAKKSAPKVHDCEQPATVHHVNIAVRVVKSPLTKDVRTMVLCESCYRQHEARSAVAMRDQHQGDWGGVLHEDVAPLIDRRLSYQPIDDSCLPDGGR